MLVAAIRSDQGASRVLLAHALKGGYRLLLSVPLMLEYEAVLTRPEHLEAARLSSDDVQILLDAIAAVGERIRLSYLWRPAVSDPQDDMVLETAVNGRAQMIVTFNRRHFEPVAVQFGRKVRLPGEAVRYLEALS